MRVVSLIASATEITSALGPRAALVGRSHECDTPENVLSLPALTKTKFDTGLPSRVIDTAVKSLVRDGLSVYQVDGMQLRALAPDVILTQDQCEVCAASLKDVEAAVCNWIGQPVRIVSLHPNCLADIWKDIRAVGKALNCEDRAAALISDAQTRISFISTTTATERPRVLCVEWIEPLMAAGHWISELVNAAGGKPLLARSGGPSPYISIDQIAAADPDVIAVAPCGFDVDRNGREMAVLDNNPAWRSLRAVRQGRVAVADGNHYFNRPSPAVADTVDILKDILDHFGGMAGTESRFDGSVWRPWTIAEA